MKKLVCLLLAALLLAACLAGCAGRGRPENEIIAEMIASYGSLGEEADAKVDGLLAELRRTNGGKWSLWKGIMDYWRGVNTELELNTGALPDGLPDGDGLCLVILGFELNPDGSMKEELIGRLRTGLACAEQYPEAYVLCTGGGTAWENRDATEAGQMGAWLREHGLREERLILEDRSLSTAENAKNSCGILLAEYPQVDSVVIVSSSYHIPWGAVLFETAFLKAASDGRTPEIHVISNCAWPASNPAFPESGLLRWQMSGILQLIGDDDLSRRVYSSIQ